MDRGWVGNGCGPNRRIGHGYDTDVLLLLESSSSMCCMLFSVLFSDDLATAPWSGEVRCSGMMGFVHCTGDDVVWHHKVVSWVGGLLNIQSVF